MTDRRRRQKENRTARREAERKADSRKELFRRIRFAFLLGTAVVGLFVVGSFFGGDDAALPGSYESYRQQDTACGASQPPPETLMRFDTFEPQPDVIGGERVTATISTSCGEIVIALDAESSPETVQSFVFLARQGFYDGIVFHRIVDDFVIQAGDPDAIGSGGPGYTISDEFPPSDFVYEPGVVAMANAGRGTTGSQFFIVVGESASVLTNLFNLLGTVVEGRETLDLIEAVPTATRPSAREQSLPLETVYIESIEIEVG